jgi:signal transduction histidine kinase
VLVANRRSQLDKLGGMLDGLSRWYVAVPPFLIVAFLIALFFLAGAGQSRLQGASERLQRVATREQAINELQGAVDKTESEQRGFLLTGEKRYLANYRKAVDGIQSRLERLRLAYRGSEANLADVRNLNELIGKRLGDMDASVALDRASGPGHAVALVKTNVGAEVSGQISSLIDKMRFAESLERNDADAHWEASVHLSRWITICGMVFNLLLVGIASRLVYKEMRRRSRQTAELRDQKLLLERTVEERTEELVELSTHLQSVAEREKASLARELHDELGGLLVGARMDASWAEQHLSPEHGDIKKRLIRVQQSLSAGVDLKRRIIEELRPTLLDNVGLVAAIRWQLKETCGRAGISCTENYPEEDLSFNFEASIALFRIAQEAFINILKHAHAKSVDLALDTTDDTFTMRIADDGKGMAVGRFRLIGSHGVASMRHRIRALGGKFDISCPPSGGTILTARIPLRNVVLTEPSPEMA